MTSDIASIPLTLRQLRTPSDPFIFLCRITGAELAPPALRSANAAARQAINAAAFRYPQHDLFDFCTLTPSSIFRKQQLLLQINRQLLLIHLSLFVA
jgi:hypothetical protein